MVASEKRLTSMRRLSTRPGAGACCQMRRCSPDDQVHQLAGDDDLLHDLLAVDVASYGVVRAGELDELFARGVGGRLDARAALAVHLDDEREDVARQKRRIGRWPPVLPPPQPGDRL